MVINVHHRLLISEKCNESAKYFSMLICCLNERNFKTRHFISKGHYFMMVLHWWHGAVMAMVLVFYLLPVHVLFLYISTFVILQQLDMHKVDNHVGLSIRATLIVWTTVTYGWQALVGSVLLTGLALPINAVIE